MAYPDPSRGAKDAGKLNPDKVFPPLDPSNPSWHYGKAGLAYSVCFAGYDK